MISSCYCDQEVSVLKYPKLVFRMGYEGREESQLVAPSFFSGYNEYDFEVKYMLVTLPGLYWSSVIHVMFLNASQPGRHATGSKWLYYSSWRVLRIRRKTTKGSMDLATLTTPRSRSYTKSLHVNMRSYSLNN